MHTQAKPLKRIVDLGAGHGDDLVTASVLCPEAELVAVETWPPYVEELSSNGILVYQLNIERDKLPFLSEAVDAVIANQLLEHTKELFWIFHEVTRILSIGGKFIIGIPNLASLHNRILLMAGRQPSPIKSTSAHVRGFTKHDLCKFINDCFPAGYQLIGFGGSNFYPFPPYLAKPLANIFPSLAWGIFFMFEKQRQYSREFLDYPVHNKLETNFFLGE
ncbi:MAG TPA: methyltransferase domain-containing protein [Syntrophales bacterium]|nr:methyltransferase domain-containing protein [Syntrophales bacterium]